MKLSKFTLTLTAAVLLPAFAHAAADDTAAADDPVLASFERDYYRDPVPITVAGETDVLTIEFYTALRDVLDMSARHAAVGAIRTCS